MDAKLAFFVIAAIFLIVNKCAQATDNSGVQYSYSGANGPDKWGSLAPQFAACTNGKSQSPIDFATKSILLNKNLQPLKRVYSPTNVTLVNNVVNVGLHYGENSGILISDGKKYKLKQMHWHTPSEHKINGVQFPAELHLVHIADDGSYAVVGELYRLGQPDPLIAQIQNKLHVLSKEVSGDHGQGQVTLGTFDVKQLNKDTRRYYKYNGSFTTPPCTETVAWHILGKVRSISSEQIEALEAPLSPPYKQNARPVQPLNGRQVQLYAELN